MNKKIMFNKNGIETADKKNAVAIKNNGVYQILVSNDGQIFDPYDRFHLVDKKDSIRGGSLFNLQKCKFECFDAYLKYLRGRNRGNIEFAQRRLLDGC